jgi:methylenetetrahydrofolate reductase (NADPH)
MIPISFEYFPPKTAEQKAVFQDTHAALKLLSPEYFSVTFGAGGSTLEHTEDTVLAIHREQPVAPHISCLGGHAESIGQMLDRYREVGINRIVALRGDMPSGMGVGGEFRYANELVRFIRQHAGDHFHIHVACYPEFHPESETAHGDLDHLRQKIDAGANEAITQFFFNADAYFRFVDDCRARGIDVPIVAGIMPIINFTQLARFSDMCGAEMPRWLRKRLRDFGDDRASIRSFGIDVISDMCQRLVAGGAPGLHFYTLNRAAAAVAICRNLGIGEALKK